MDWSFWLGIAGILVSLLGIFMLGWFLGYRSADRRERWR